LAQQLNRARVLLGTEVDLDDDNHAQAFQGVGKFTPGIAKRCDVM
jgi:hypothetical protein